MLKQSTDAQKVVEHLPVKLNVKVIKPQYAQAPTSAIKRDVNE